MARQGGCGSSSIPAITRRCRSCTGAFSRTKSGPSPDATATRAGSSSTCSTARGYSIVEGKRIDWKKGDLVLLPLNPNEVEHQHFNLDPEKPALWAAFIHIPIQEHLASDLQQTENSPEFKE